MKRYLQVVMVVLIATLTFFSGSAAAKSLRVANHVYYASFIDANGYSTKYQVVCFTGGDKAAYVNADGVDEHQQPLFNPDQQQQAKQLHSYLTSKKQRQEAAKAGRFTIKGNRLTINNGLLNNNSSAKIDQDGTGKKFIARYPSTTKRKDQTVIFQRAPQKWQYK